MSRFLVLASLGFLVAGCFTFDVSTKEETPHYANIVARHTEKDVVAVAAFAEEKGLTSNRRSARAVFGAIAGTLFGVTLIPWDLRLTATPDAVDEDTEFDVAAFDEVLATEIAINLKQKRFDAKLLNPTEWETARQQALTLVKLEDLLAQAKEYGCRYLYVVRYNEYVRLRYAVDTRTVPSVGTYNRVKDLEGVALLPARCVFRVRDGKRLLARAHEFEQMFYMIPASWGWITPLDKGTVEHEKWFGKMSGKDLSQARGNAALFLVETDFEREPVEGLDAPAPEDLPDEYPEDEPSEPGTGPEEDRPSEDEPPAEKPADEKPADEKPADEEPADEKPADEKPADEKPADEKPADEKPADEKPADEKPADEKPADEKPADEKPADEKPADEKPADEKPADEKPADEEPADEKPADEKPADEKPADDEPSGS